MNAGLSNETAPIASGYQFSDYLGMEIPLPALQRDWLHVRELVQPWYAERIAENIGADCWFSHYQRDPRTEDSGDLTMALQTVGGFWPDGGFIELQLQRGNKLEDHPLSMVRVFAASPARSEAIMAELLEHYRHDTDIVAREPRIGILNFAYGNLTVERVPVSEDQTVSRERLDLYYRDGMQGWTDSWIQTLKARRYGLTVLTGAPGTGKTTLLRSLAHWLGETHVFYFMPAARFASVESGEIVSFWTTENRNSTLRKVLILEDAESVLLRRGDDNREKVATLLNLTDGMLGDALGLHVVCTLNSELADLDPALLRPGRLVAHREFQLLSAEDARRLAEALGMSAPPGEFVSLAEFFNRAVTTPVARPAPTTRRSMGFHTMLPPT